MKTNQAKWVGLVCVLAGIGALVAGCPGLQPVPIPDQGLEAAMRDELGQPLGFLVAEDLRELQQLDARSRSIQDLAGLEVCTGLTWLDLSGNDISDISQVAALTSLNHLDLANNDISNIAALETLSALRNIVLTGNEIRNLQPLVTNAEATGIGPQTYVTLSREYLVDANGDLLPDVQDEYDRLVQLGVNLVLTSESNGAE